MLRMAVQTLARQFLPRRASSIPVVSVLRGAVRHCRDQQQLLSVTRSGDLRPVARAGTRTVPIRSQSQPIPDAHEETQGSGGSPRSDVFPGRQAGEMPGCGALPIAAAVAAEPRALRTLP